MGGFGVERSDQLDELRHLRAAESLRVQQGEGGKDDVGRAHERSGRRVKWHTREGRDGRVPPSRTWPVGHDATRRRVVKQRRQFSPKRGGSFDVRLEDWERDLLRDLPRQLRELLMANDPSLRRLFPAAYHADAEHEAEYQKYMRDELLASRFAAVDILEKTADAKTITEGDMLATMNAINSIRLVIGTQLDVSEDSDGPQGDDARESQAYAVYGWLGYLLEVAVEALQGTVPDEGTEQRH